MAQTKEKTNFWKRILRIPAESMRWFSFAWLRLWVFSRNRARKLRRLNIDYIVMPIGGSLPERAAPRPGFIGRRLQLREPELSMQELNERLRKIGDADNVKGVVFIFQGFQAGIASIQNLRRSMERLRETGKKVVVYTPYLDLRHYYAAAAADRVIVPPGATFEVLGLHTEVLFLKEALQKIGVQVDVVQISPYKTAMDTLQYSDMTPEFRAQLNWLLDDQYDTITAALAADRGFRQEEMMAFIDQAPMFAADAQEKGLLDDVAYEDELAFHLAAEDGEDKNQSTSAVDKDNAVSDQAPGGVRDKKDSESSQPKAKLKTWNQARKQLLEVPRRRSRHFVGVISMSGLITMGPSRRLPINLPIPLVGGSSIGEQSALSLLRRAERLQGMAALIIHVDSSGGSALASELIARQIRRLGQKIPVLVYMGNVAASGGYYISARAKHIMCQKNTITGSIGVISGRPSTSELFEKVKINRTGISRGRHAGLYSEPTPLSTEERQILWDGILHTYKQFKREVAGGRGLPYEELDPVCEGRVWTGRQAREHQLVDSHGDFVDAVREAAKMGDISLEDHEQIKVVNLYSKKDSFVLPQPYQA
ncbi:MAG: signal peptide peptidase SppA, partial [Candidatus Promineifilaceae bacterium]|nr:signal peptide peptidase SppA [Candidatus Promineifilaceae bacterium]